MGEINWKDKCWVTTIYLVNEDKKVLLTWNKNLQTWIPVGGHIEYGETPEEAIRREVAEETGFDFEFLHLPMDEDNGNVIALKVHLIQIEKVPHHGHHMNIIFFGRCTRYDARGETDEQEKLKWFSESDLLRMKEGMIENVWKSSLEALRECSNFNNR